MKYPIRRLNGCILLHSGHNAAVKALQDRDLASQAISINRSERISSFRRELVIAIPARYHTKLMTVSLVSRISHKHSTSWRVSSSYRNVS
ncbi:hypothetical protein D918_02199 [Trichuris suis]|nr:hypothetical protein D918_02199 [Trichuris suis]